MFNPLQSLESGLYPVYINKVPDYGGIDFSVKDLVDKAKITLKGYKTVLVPYYKNKWHDFRKKHILKYPITSFAAGAALIFTPFAALWDPRPVTFGFLGTLVAAGYITDILSGAPHDPKNRERLDSL